MNQMALMTQMAGAMGIMNPGAGQFMNGAFPMQPGMGGDMMFNGGMNGMQQMGGMDSAGGRGRGRGRSGPGSRGTGRGRGGQPGTSHVTTHTTEVITDGTQASPRPPAASVPTPAIIAPTPTPAASISPVTSSAAVVPSTSSTPALVRSGFVPPERPQSPTLCKYGLKCTNPVCRYSHPSPVATAESGVVLSNEACENGKNCKDKDCIKAHVSPAVLNPNGKSESDPVSCGFSNHRITTFSYRAYKAEHLCCSGASQSTAADTLQVWRHLHTPQLSVSSSSSPFCYLKDPLQSTLSVWCGMHACHMSVPAP